MKLITLRNVVMAVLLTLPAFGQLPGTGIKITQLSDDFENPNWSFNYASNISSNGMWYGSLRGAPEVLNRTTPPAGGIPGQTGALQIRSRDNDNDGYPQQEDLVTKFHNQLYGRYLQRADQPSFVAHIYMPPYASMQKDWSTLGFRIEARSNQLNPGYYYPSIWLQYYNYGGNYPNNFGVVVRMGDGFASDVYVKNMGANYAGGWVSVGISFDELGIGHYYFKEGVLPFTAADKIYDTTMFPGGSNAKMDWIAYHFLSIGYNANDPDLSPDYRIDDVSVYIVPEPATIGVLALGAVFVLRRARH